MPNKSPLDGPVLYAQWGCLSTRAWMLSMGNRLDELEAPTRWVNCSTTVVTLCPPFLWQCLLARLFNWAVIQPGCFSRLVTLKKHSHSLKTWFTQCFCAMTLFYCAHWQTYVSGTLRFGKVDVTEAQMTIMAILLISAIFGPSIWSVKVSFSLICYIDSKILLNLKKLRFLVKIFFCGI